MKHVGGSQAGMQGLHLENHHPPRENHHSTNREPVSPPGTTPILTWEPGVL